MRLLPVNEEPTTLFMPSASAAAAPPTPATFKSFHVGQSFFSARAAGKLGIGRWVEVEMKSTSVVVVYEVMLMSDREDPPQVVDDEVWINRYGAGIRIELSVQDVTARMQLDAYSVALSIDAGMSRCGYRYTLLGNAMGPDLELPRVGMYDTSTYETLLKAVDKTRRYMAKNAANLTPVLTHVYGGTVSHAAGLREAQSVMAGVGAVRDFWKEEDAVAQAQKSGLAINAVRTAYRMFAPGLPSTQRPGEQQARDAAAWWERTNP